MDNRWKQFAESLIGDIRYALRGLRNAPGYAVTAVLTLALGLGAVTAMLAVVDSVLLRPVALPHAEQLMNLGAVGSNGGGGQFSFAQLDTLGRETPGIQALLAIAAGLLAAVAPYISAMRAVTEFSAQSTRTVSRSHLSGALIVLEIAMTCVLLITAGLFLRTSQDTPTMVAAGCVLLAVCAVAAAVPAWRAAQVDPV
jgi:hypothetical protein